MYYLTKKHLSRRTVLRGAGVALALPLLESMIPAGMRRASAQTRARPRFAAINIAHGAVMDRWTPRGEGRDFEFTPTLQSLEPFRDRLNVISDLTLPAAYVGDASAGAHHRRSAQCWLTCYPPGEGPTPTSADQIAVQHIGQETPMPSLELTLEPGNSLSYRTPDSPNPMEINPRIVFERLFGDGSTAEERAARHRQAVSLLDAVLQDVAALRQDLPAADQLRMDRYLEDVREIERRLALAGDAAPDELAVPDKPVGVPDDFEQHARLMFDLLALAWQADLTRIATMIVAQELSNRVFPSSGVNEPFHNLSHHSEVVSNIDRLAQLNEYHTRVTIAYFLEKLRNTPDGDGNLLDNSIVLYGSGMSNSNQHDHTPLPMLLAGGGAGRLQGGRHLRAGGGTTMANLLVTILDKLDVPVESLGDSTGALSV